MREGRKRRKLKTRSLAWLLTLVMVMSLVVVPGKKAEAAGSDIELTVTTSNELTVDANNNADVNISKPDGYGTIAELVNAGYTKLQISYSITSYTAAGTSKTPGL